jgi:hypothetical protein
MGDLVRASDAGLLQGDPLKPYLRPMISQGGGPAEFGDPAMLLEAVKHFIEALRTVGEVYAGGLAGGAIFRRLRGVESVDEQELVTRNAGADELNEMLRHYRELTLPVLARALAADEEAATGIAGVLGYDVEADGAIVYSREPDAEFARALLGWLRYDVYTARDDDEDIRAPFAEERRRALGEGRLEGESDWRHAWIEANPNAYGSEPVDPEQSEEGSEEEEEWDDHFEYRVVTIREDQGVLDQAEIEAQLAKAAADDCMLVASLQGVKLYDGGTGVVLIFMQ